MQSATSFFNRALFRKNLQRFWPLWLGYVLIWLLLLPLPLLNELADYHGVSTVADASYYLLQIGAYGGLVMGAVFGIFFAMAMFAYLTNPRATQGFHSMPVRRETLYATNYLTGLVCMVSALVLAFALAGITAACFGALDITALGTALLAAVLSVLFFYSFGVFCMMFTGQILAAPVFYGILNVLAAGMEWLVRTFAGNFLYGYSGYSAPETFAFLSPAWELVCVLDVSNVARVDRILSDGTHQVIRGDEYMLSGLGVLGIYAAVGIVLAVLGLLVYRRRASEATGSIVTVPWMCPVFKYGVAVCAAFSLGQLIYFLVFGLNLHNGQYSLPGTIACMLFTGLLGYFAAEMLLHKSFRVWRTGRVGALVFSAVLVCFGVAMSLDLTGYEGYTPDAEEVEFVSVYLSSNGDYLSCKLDEPESIERTLAAHRAMIADKARQLSYARTTYETPADAPVDSYLYFTWGGVLVAIILLRHLRAHGRARRAPQLRRLPRLLPGAERARLRRADDDGAAQLSRGRARPRARRAGGRQEQRLSHRRLLRRRQRRRLRRGRRRADLRAGQHARLRAAPRLRGGSRLQRLAL